MPDEENYTKTSHIMFLKEQVLRFAAPIKHSHTYEQLRDWLGEDYIPRNHASDESKYGVGSTNEYGHVKVDENIDKESTNPVQNKSIADCIDRLKTSLSKRITKLEEWVDTHSIVNEINSDNKDDEESIPTIKAVYDAILNYEDLLVGIDLARPLPIDENIDLMRTPGYFQQTGIRHFSYGGETIYYANALIKVEKQSNRVVQHVYATSRVTSNGDDIYKINGCEYTRWGISENSWGAWHVAHKPYTKTTRAKIDEELCPGVDPDSVVVYENTSGFMIHWNQYKEERDTYTVTAPLYEYSDVCKFEPPLPIKGPIIFGNLIGKFDVKITSDKMQIRSNMNSGGKIVEVHEVYHVLRNQ